MKRVLLILCTLILLVNLAGFSKYSGEIFELPNGVRNMALGGTGLTDIASYSPAYWNSSLMPEISSSRIELMHATEFDKLYSYDALSFFYNGLTSLGFTLTRIAIDNIPLTKLPNPDAEISNDNRPYVYKYVDNQDYLLLLGMGRKLNDRWNIGLTPKLIYRNLAEKSAFALGADFGFLYKPYRNLMIGGKVSNVVSTHVMWEDGHYESVSPKTELEFRYNFTLFRECVNVSLAMKNDFYMFADSDIGEYDLGITSLSNHFGMEIQPFNRVSFLAGYDIDSPTAGFDYKYHDFSLFYVYKFNSDEGLGDSQKISLGYNF